MSIKNVEIKYLSSQLDATEKTVKPTQIREKGNIFPMYSQIRGYVSYLCTRGNKQEKGELIILWGNR